MTKQIAYTVRGSWPFPLDMLRRDQSAAATPADQALIDELSGDHLGSRAEITEINLVGPCAPNYERWVSFTWEVTASSDRYFDWSREQAEASAHRQSGLAKLTAAERNALNLAA